MALACQEDRALLESNLSAWRGSAGDNRGWFSATLVSFSDIISVENKSDKLILPDHHFLIQPISEMDGKLGYTVLPIPYWHGPLL